MYNEDINMEEGIVKEKKIHWKETERKEDR